MEANQLSNKESFVPAKITLKNGRCRYGILLDFYTETTKGIKNVFKFVCNSKWNIFAKTEDAQFVEMYNVHDIESIDTCLK